MIGLDGTRIVRMEAEGIAYLGAEGVEQFISFVVCYENELEGLLQSESWERYKELNNLDDSHWEDCVERVKSYKKVADRNIHDFYIEFYTEPRIHFKFASLDEWWKLRKHIEKSGWRTRDMA
jgi:hypothetical protein